MKPILLATDGSPTAEEATAKAIELAQQLDDVRTVGVEREGVREGVT